MKKVIFKFDRERDAKNYWQKSNSKNKWIEIQMPPEIKKICENKTFEESRKGILNYLKKYHNSELINIYLNSVNISWKKIEDEFFNRIEKLMKRKYKMPITAYLTTFSVCPYNPLESSFMFSFFNSLPKTLENCGHEIMHLYFHKFYWDNLKEKIKIEDLENLKEALTVLLNLEFKDLWFVEDKGYESHKKLREFISENWKKKKDFDELIFDCIEFLNER